MKNFFFSLILPLQVFWLLMFFAFYFDFSWRKRLSTRIILLAFSLLMIVSTPFVPNLLVRNLENQYRVLSNRWLAKDNRPVHILVLGGGHTNDEKLPATNQLSGSALARLVEGIRIHRLLPGSFVVTSGYGGKEPITQAEVLANAALLLGVERSSVRMQKNPENTWMEATEYKRIFGDTAQLILVTSAVHMPRAMYLFRKAGLNPIAAPTNHLVKKEKK